MAETTTEKSLIALRNHSEAEQRRRDRINGHLATLRTLFPSTKKMDKAELLSQVITKVKELKHGADEAANGKLLPSDADEILVEPHQDGASFSIRASLCCDFKHELLKDVREVMKSLHLKMERAEIATHGNRMVIIFVISGFNDANIVKLHVDYVRKNLQSVLDKVHASEELMSKRMDTRKRRRIGEMWLQES